MGTRITSNDTLAPWYSKVVPPVTRGLEGWFTFDTDISRFGLNRAIGKQNGSVIGTPVAYATHGRFKGSTNFIQTAIKDSDEITMFAVVKALVAPTSNADGVAAISTYNGTSVTPAVPGSSGGSSILLRGSSVVSAGIARSPGGVYQLELVNIVGGAPTAWRLLCVRSKSGSASEARDMTYNVSKLGTDLTTRVVNDKLFRIGSATTDYSGESDISAAAIYSAYLTDEEISLVAVAMRKRMLRLGISV
jgi:hypothetical protein